MAGEYDGSEPLRSDGGILVPQVWDATLNGGDGGFRVVTPADLAADAPLAAPSSNIARTAVGTGAAAPLPAGACVKGFLLQADMANGGGLVYWGKAGVDLTHGAQIAAGESVFIRVTDTAAIAAIADAAGCYVTGIRF
jgi:hypothetical protein